MIVNRLPASAFNSMFERFNESVVRMVQVSGGHSLTVDRHMDERMSPCLRQWTGWWKRGCGHV